MNRTKENKDELKINEEKDNPKSVIAVDIDCVLAESLEPCMDHHNRKHGYSLKRDDFKSHRWWEPMNVSREESHRLFCAFIRDEGDRIIPVSGSVETIKKLHKEFRIIAVTAREKTEKETKEWVDKHFLGMIDEIYYSKNPDVGYGSKTKREICEMIEARFFIEDQINFAEEAADSVDFVFLKDEPWNRVDITKDNVIRVCSWDEIYGYIQKFK